MADSASSSSSRHFAAASVPHLHWPTVPAASRQKKSENTSGPKLAPPHAHGHGGRKSTGSIPEPQNVRRKSQSAIVPTGTISKIGDTEKSVRFDTSHVEVTPLQRSIASGVGTVFMTLIMNPLDVVKVRLQAQHKLLAKKPISRGKKRLRPATNPISGIYREFCSAASLGEKGYQATTTPRLNGTFDAFRTIIKMEGVSRLWSGTIATLLMRIPCNVIYFTVYDGLKSWLGFESGHANDMKSILTTIFASGTARTMSIALVSPLDLIRTKLQSQYLTYPELGRCLKSGFQAEGVYSLWRGVGPTILRDVPYAIMYWTNYELLKTQVMKVCNVTEPTVAMTFWCGTASGVFASIITTPFDVVKTNKQIAIGEAANYDGAPCPTRQNTWRMMQQIRAQSGISGLFAGVGPRVLMSAPASAILITCYEFTLHMFRDYNARQCGLT